MYLRKELLMFCSNTYDIGIPDVIIKKSFSIWLKEASVSCDNYRKFWSKAPIYLIYEFGKTGIISLNSFDNTSITPLCDCIYDTIVCISISDFHCLLALYKDNKCGLLCIDITDHQNITIQSKIVVPCIYDSLKVANFSEDTVILFFDKQGVKYYNPITDLLSPYYKHIASLPCVISFPNAVPFLHCVCADNTEIILDSYDDSIILYCKKNHSYKHIGCCRNGVLIWEEPLSKESVGALYFFCGYETISECYRINGISKYRLNVACKPNRHSHSFDISIAGIHYRKNGKWNCISTSSGNDMPIDLFKAYGEVYQPLL